MKFGNQVFNASTDKIISGSVPDSIAVKEALESTYSCLGITCAHVGALSDSLIVPAMKYGLCTHQTYIAGYTPGSNVAQHNALDLDQKDLVTKLAADAAGTGAFVTATSVYANGGVSTTNSACITGQDCFNSMSKGSARTLKGFSTGAKSKMYDNAYGPYRTYKKFYDYYGDGDYADKGVSAARIEAVKKGTAYQHVWMYVIREFEDAIDDCNNCVTNCNEFSTSGSVYDSVHAWDEGVAFYTGSLAGPFADDKSGSMVYALAEKRCGNFGTCHIRGGLSKVNTELFVLFDQGRDLLKAGTCSKVRPVLDKIISLMTVPLVQGTLRYAWRVGTTGGVPNKAGDQKSKNHAEGATFAQALLPLVHHCNTAAAKVVSDHMKFGNQVFDATTDKIISGSVPDSIAVKEALESTYSCL